MLINKPWGSEEILESNGYLFKRLVMNSGHQCSLQYHDYKQETLYIISGILKLTLEDNIYIMYPGDYKTILPKQIHRMQAILDCIYLESSTTPIDNCEDVIRLEDDYKRV